MDKKKQIEETAKDIVRSAGLGVYEKAKYLTDLGYRKIPENAVVIPKEVSCCDNVEERIRTFNLDGNKVDFTDEQIMAITSIFHYKEMQAKEIRKETAEKFARLVEFHSVSTRDENGREMFTISALGLKEILHEEFGITYDEICKEITGGKV